LGFFASSIARTWSCGARGEGVERRPGAGAVDEFEAVGLGRHRATEEWVAVQHPD
jgi:hypothetical protein